MCAHGGEVWGWKEEIGSSYMGGGVTGEEVGMGEKEPLGFGRRLFARAREEGLEGWGTLCSY